MDTQNNEFKDINERDEKETNDIKPWFSIWLKPRKTMRYVLDTKPGKLFLLIYLGILVTTLDRGASNEPGDTMNLFSILFTYIIGSLFFTAIAYYIVPLLLRWTGSLLGGRGTTEEVRYAYAYSYIPYVYTLIFIWIPSLLLFGINNFTTEYAHSIYSSSTLTNLMFIFNLLDLIIAIWAIFTTIKCLAEAHQFSSWRSLGAIIISFLVIFIPLFILFALIFPILINFVVN
ncbi:Yip1 family protein [Chengkuizengella marina]|nr:Yip1 family protein [Chengkuizengella marina]